MPRIRTLKPEFWQDEKLVTLPDVARLIFLGLVSLADDAGRLLDKPVKIEADLFDGMHDRSRDVRESLANLSRIGVIRRGLTASGQRVIEIVNWKKHQRVDHPNLKAAFPQIVTVLEDTEIREAFANDSRGIREAFAHHTNDLHTNDQRPTTNSAARKRTAPGGGDGPKYPHFPMPLCLEMHALWVSRFGAVTVPVFRKEFGPLFTIAEADRPTTAPTDAELRDALKSYVDLAPMGDGATFATVRRAAGVLAAIASARREYANEPERRLEAVMRILHGRQRVAA